jgi:hypothetical protein
MTEIIQRHSGSDTDAKIARFLAQEEEKYKAKQKEVIKAMLYPAGLIVGMAGIGIASFAMYTPILNASPSKDIAGIVEEWSVSHPTQNIPATDEFIDYSSYLHTLGMKHNHESMDSLELKTENPSGLMVKVVKNRDSTSPAAFTVCSYADGKDDMDSFDSVTGKSVTNELKTCS